MPKTLETIRQLTNVRFYRGAESEIGRDVEWVQRKIETDGTRQAEASSSRVSDYADQIDSVILTDPRTGRRTEQAIMRRRYATSARKEVAEAGEAFCAEIQHAVAEEGLEVVGFGYAPGSPNVDVWCRKQLNTLNWSGFVSLQDDVFLEMAQAFLELVAERFADPGQTLTALPILSAAARGIES